MRAADLLRLTAESLLRFRLRSVLTVVGVAIGAFAVLALTALGGAAQRYVVDRFAALGANLVVVSPGRIETSGTFGAAGASRRELTVEDAEAVRTRAAGVRATAPMSLGTAGVSHGDRRRDVYVIGTTAAFAHLRDLAVDRGAFLPEGDVHGGAAVVVIGSKLARELFGTTDPLGRVVRISEARFRVVGVLAPKGQSLGSDIDDMAFVPVGRALRLFDRVGLHHVLVQAAEPAGVPGVVRAVREVLVERHREEDFTIVTQGAMVNSFRAIIDAITGALVAIACVSLAVAGIGIMNVMLVTVSERVPEVGLLKALGASPRQIAGMFLAEAIVLSLAGAAVATFVAAVGIELAASRWPTIPFRHSLPWIGVVAAFSLAAGTLFGWIPARRAGALDPVRSLEGRR